MDWVIVTDNSGKKVGAIGFIGDTAVVIAAFYADLDGNKDGRVSIGERVVGWISPIPIKGMAVTQVAMLARGDSDIVLRDPTFNSLAMNQFFDFARSAIVSGIYTVYFSQAVSSITGAIAGKMTKNFVAQYVIRKGMETTVKAEYTRVMQQR